MSLLTRLGNSLVHERVRNLGTCRQVYRHACFAFGITDQLAPCQAWRVVTTASAYAHAHASVHAKPGVQAIVVVRSSGRLRSIWISTLQRQIKGDWSAREVG